MLSTRYGIFIQAGAVVNKASDGGCVATHKTKRAAWGCTEHANYSRIMVDVVHKLGRTNILLACFLSYSARESRRSAMTDKLNIIAKHGMSTWFPVESCYLCSINKIYNAGIRASIAHHVIREFGIVFGGVLCLCYFFVQQNIRGSGLMWRKHLFMICASYDLNTKNEQHNNGAAHCVQISFLALPFSALIWVG